MIVVQSGTDRDEGHGGLIGVLGGDGSMGVSDKVRTLLMAGVNERAWLLLANARLL